MDFTSVKNKFPIFRHHPDLVYLDSAATTLKPQSVIDAVTGYYERYSANVGRGLYPIAEEATEKFEETRGKVAAFIGGKPDEIVFVHGATEGFNLLASSLGSILFPVIADSAPAERDDPESKLRIAALAGNDSPAGNALHSNADWRSDSGRSQTPRNDKTNVVVTEMEHHSNFLPWKRLAQEHDSDFRLLPIDAEGMIDRTSFKTLIDENTAIVSFSAVSNVLGTKISVADTVGRIRSIRPETMIVVDASQAVGHSKIDVTEWDADFVVFSGHKMFGPTGIGIVWGREKALAGLPPYQLGGGMVANACSRKNAPHHLKNGAVADSYTDPVWKDAPYRFEAGTPSIASAIGLGAAVDFIQEIGIGNIEEHESELTRYALSKLAGTFGSDITIFGAKDPERHAGLISFTLKGIHPHDLAQILGERGICIRAGEHCASPIHRKLGLSSTARLSLSIYNDEKDIDQLIEAMKKARERFTI